VARPLVIAHRGARRRAPENTLEAFRLALELGADGVELDVHRTADDQLVVHHDAEARGTGVLARATLEAIRSSRPDIPTLDEALEACAGALVNIEIKNDPADADFDPGERSADLVVAALDRRGGGDVVIVSSFDLASIDRVHALDGSVPTGLLPNSGLSALDAVELCAARGHRAVHPYLRWWNRTRLGATTTRAHDLGLQVNVCTLNSPRRIRKVAGFGVDGVMTDVPDVALRALAE
jgi:glycerophosphoryl diester phosphodiesterase